MDGKTIEECREDFPALKRQRKGKPPIYLDNACTTMVPRQVIASIEEYYTDYPACSGTRSRHWFAREVFERIEGNPGKEEGSRRIIAGFINASSEKEIIFTMNTTHALNMVALFRSSPVMLFADRYEHNSICFLAEIAESGTYQD